MDKSGEHRFSHEMDVSKNRGTPKSSILIGFFIIFTIHFGGKIPLFLVQHPNPVHPNPPSQVIQMDFSSTLQAHATVGGSLPVKWVPRIMRNLLAKMTEKTCWESGGKMMGKHFGWNDMLIIETTIACLDSFFLCFFQIAINICKHNIW